MLMSEQSEGTSSPEAESATIDRLLQDIQDKVGNLPVSDEDPPEYPGQPYGNFETYTDAGQRVAFEVFQVPVQASYRGEVALIRRRQFSADPNAPQLEATKEYYFFNTGGGQGHNISLEG